MLLSYGYICRKTKNEKQTPYTWPILVVNTLPLSPSHYHCFRRWTVLLLDYTGLPTERHITHSLLSVLRERRAACLTDN
jgi:hypothetical protein